MAEATRGRVVVAYSQDCLVETGDNRLLRCATRRNTGKPYCGDYLQVEVTGAETGVVSAIEPRHNLIARPNYQQKLKPMAANVDLLVVVLAPRPAFERILIDRYLAMAEHLKLDALIWVNKIDLLAQAERAALMADLAGYAALGYTVAAGSAASGDGIDALQTALAGRTGILVGQSGVGKSSLISRLVPDIELRIGALSHASGLGKHTTTETTLYHLPDSGDLIDSPGIRTLRLGHLSQKELQAGFREIEQRAAGCRFPDCRHRNEPGCEVTAAVAAGEVDARRLESLHALLEEEGR